jgi:hypothetical protein
MAPDQLAAALRAVAAKIDNSKEPSKELVADAIKHLIAGVEKVDIAPPFVTPAEDAGVVTNPETRVNNPVNPPSPIKRQEPCDHYRLVREGGRCPNCGEYFKPNFGNF